MPDRPDRIQIYRELIEFLLRTQNELISIDRLNLFLSKARKKYSILQGMEVNDDFSMTLSDDFTTDEENALKAMSTVMACAFKVLEMFVGSRTAREKILGSINKYRDQNPRLDDAGLQKYLPKIDEKAIVEIKSPQEDEGAKEDRTKNEDLEDLDILKPKDGIPFYNEEKKEWVLRPAHIVKNIQDEQGLGIKPVFEESALKKRKTKKKVKKRPKEEPVENLTWLQTELETGHSYFVEGTGQEKNMLCAQFIKEGLDAGEDVIAILGYPPKLFLGQMQKIGVREKDLEKIHIIDWHTFKEKHVVGPTSSGQVHIVPKDPKFMGTVLTKIIASLGKNTKKRAFVSVVSYALAFIDIETIYNFVQITRLKFKKGKVTGLFTMEAGQHGKETRDSFKEISDGWIRVSEGLSGANTWKMKVGFTSFSKKEKVVKDVVIMRNGIVVLEHKGGAELKDGFKALGVEEGLDVDLTDEEDKDGGTHIDSYLLEKVEMWKNLGFSVTSLDEAMEEGNDAFAQVLKEFEKIAGQALRIRGRLDDVATLINRMKDKALADEVLKIRAKIRDLEDLDEMDENIDILSETVKGKLEKEGRRRDREKEIFRIRMEHWSRQGYDTSILDAVMDSDLETVNQEFAAFRTVVNRLKRIEEDIYQMDMVGHEAKVERIKNMLFDVKRIKEIEELYRKLREEMHIKERIKETAKGRRNELMDEIFNWALEGYCVDLMDKVDIFKEDLSSLEGRLGRLRVRIQRLKEAEKLINTLDLSKNREEEVSIRKMIKDVDKVEEVEAKVHALQERTGMKLSGEVLALDANMEKVRDLEETWQRLKIRLLTEAQASSKRRTKDKK